MEKKSRILFKNKDYKLIKYWWADKEHKENDDFGRVYKGYTRFLKWWIEIIAYTGNGWYDDTVKENFLELIS